MSAYKFNSGFVRLLLGSFFKVAQVGGGANLVSFYIFFSHNCSALDHSATELPQCYLVLKIFPFLELCLILSNRV